MSKSANTYTEWLAFSESAGIEIPGEDYHGLSGPHVSAFKLAGLIIDSGRSYATDHPRTLKLRDNGAHLYSFMPYVGAFYDYKSNNNIVHGYSVRQQHLENFVAYLNALYPHTVMLCDVLPFSPHAPETMTVVFYNAYEVNPALFAQHTIMRVNGKNCDPSKVDLWTRMLGEH